MPSISTYRVIRASDSAWINTVLWDGVSPLTLSGATLQLDATRPAITPPEPEPGFDVIEPAASGTAALTDADLVALRAAVLVRRATMAAAIAADPSPAAVATEGGTLGTLAQSLARLELGEAGGVTAANAALPDCLALMPTLPGWQGMVNPATDTPVFPYARPDWFHFSRPAMLYRMVRLHGAAGTGRLSAPNEAAITALLWDWAHDQPLTDLGAGWINQDDPTAGWGSENHNTQNDFVAYAAAHLISISATYAGQTYADGSTPAEQLTAWGTRVLNKLRWMGRYGVMWEFGSATYAQYTLSAIYALAECAPSSDIRAAARSLLDLYWCAWAQETCGKNHGGPRTRMYPEFTVTDDPVEAMIWLYFGGDEVGNMRAHGYSVIGLADYTPPDIAFDLMADQQGRGRYAVVTRQTIAAGPGDGVDRMNVADVLSGAPASIRYTWVTPEFAMGTIAAPHVPVDELLGGPAQNRWNAVVFGGDKSTARVVVSAVPRLDDDAQAGTIAVQDRATAVIAYQAAPYSNNASAHAVRLGTGLTWVEEDAGGRAGWVFVAGPTGYAAIKVAGGTYTWGPGAVVRPEVEPPETTTLLPSSNRPVVMQAAGNSDFVDFAAFRAAVLAQVSVAYSAGVATVTGGLFGAGTLVMDTATWATPTVDGAPINLGTGAFRSPFITAEWGGDLVHVTKGSRRLTLDFGA